MIVSLMIITTYFIVTLLYFLILYKSTDIWSDNKTMSMLITIIIMALGINLTQNYIYSSSYSKDNYCKVDLFKLSINTILPWMLIMFPSFFFIAKFNWHRIFSNTFGLFLIDQTELKDIIEPNDNPKTGVLLQFYENPYILIKEISFENKDDLENKLNLLLPEENIKINEEKYKLLSKQFTKKRLLGYAIWYFFIGVITSLVSINMVLLQQCMPLDNE